MAASVEGATTGLARNRKELRGLRGAKRREGGGESLPECQITWRATQFKEDSFSSRTTETGVSAETLKPNPHGIDRVSTLKFHESLLQNVTNCTWPTRNV